MSKFVSQSKKLSSLGIFAIDEDKGSVFVSQCKTSAIFYGKCAVAIGSDNTIKVHYYTSLFHDTRQFVQRLFGGSKFCCPIDWKIENLTHSCAYVSGIGVLIMYGDKRKLLAVLLNEILSQPFLTVSYNIHCVVNIDIQFVIYTAEHGNGHLFARWFCKK